MSIEKINEYLARDYGYFEGVHPTYRVVWSEDQFEKRESEYTDEGLKLLHPEVMLKPKYKQQHKNKYILERLLVVPEWVLTDLVDRWSYEPLHVFRIGKGDSYELDTFYGACKFIIDSVLERSRLAYYGDRYKSPEEKRTPEENLYAKKLEVDKMIEFLFGNESELTDALGRGDGVSVPNNFQANGTSRIVEN